MTEQIVFQGELLAIIVSHRFHQPGIHFFTPHELSQQLAYMCHPAGKVIEPHVHNPVPREVVYTQEVLFIKRGAVQVDFFDGERRPVDQRVLTTGDVILLVSGGHGFCMLEESEIIEVKQGPYLGNEDKTRFSPVV